MSFDVILMSIRADGTKAPVVAFKCETIEECFDVLHKRGQKVGKATLLDAYSQSSAARVRPEGQLDVGYAGGIDVAPVRHGTTYGTIDDASSNQIQIQGQPNSQFYLITDNDNQLTYNEFCSRRDSWSRNNIARKIFHPGNSLTIAFILTAVGIGLVGFGVACSPCFSISRIRFRCFFSHLSDWLCH